jgi:hyperosmotically inducible protein
MMTSFFRTLGVLIAVQVLVGCTPALVAGAGAAGYYVGKDSRSAGRIADDAAITASVKTKLAGDDLTSVIDINVDTYNGVVTLHGRVPNQRAAQRAVSLAWSTKGVVRVISKLTVVPPK